MNERPSPFASILTLAAAGLSVGVAAWDDADQVFSYPTLVVTLLAVALAVTALVALSGGGRGAHGAGVVLSLLLAGYWLNTVTLTLYFTHEFRDAIVLATLGGAVAIIGASLTLYELVRKGPASATGATRGRAERHAATSGEHSAVTGAAPAGWYPDPGGGGGQRYWDGAAWGQVHPS